MDDINQIDQSLFNSQEENMDRLTTWIMAMVTIGGMALGTVATLGALRIGGKIRVKVEQVE